MNPTIENNTIIEEETEPEPDCVCDMCGNRFVYRDGYNDDFCSSDCHNDYYEQEEGNYDDDSLPERKWCKGDFVQFQSIEPGEIVKSSRAFSAEIEAYYRTMSDVHHVHNLTPYELGISGDGSLGNNGVEFQTPKLRGKKGEELITLLTELLNKNGFRVDKSCGLHVHIDGAGLLPKTRTKHNPQAIKNLLSLYMIYEDVIQSILPRSRRNNRFAMHIRNNFHFAEIKECYSLESIEKLWYRVAKRKELKSQKDQHYNSTRYNGLNLHSLFANGHLEIRYHSGTINREKILHWIQLHLAMVDYAKKAYDIQLQPEITSLREKTEKLYHLLDLPESTREYYTMRQNLFSETHTTEDTENRTY